MKALDKVWIDEGSVYYPGILKSYSTDTCIVWKFDSVIWREINVDISCLRPRTDDFGPYMLKVRKQFLIDSFDFGTK